jgi:Leucine-rich repeat (LRR) protein
VVEVTLNFTKATDGDLKNLTPFTRLRKLVLTQDQNINGAGLKDLAGLQSLEHLDASSSPISDEGARNIAAFRKLKVLNVMGAKLTDAGIRDIATLDQLQELTASGMLLNGPAKDEPRDIALKDLGKLKQLRKLDLSNTQTGDESARAFAGLSQLRVLQVFGTRITDTGLMELARLKQLEELRVGYDISDQGVNTLGGLTELKVLGLFNNTRVTDGSIKSLTTLTSLRELDLNRTKISLKGKSEIRKSIPGIKVKS